MNDNKNLVMDSRAFDALLDATDRGEHCFRDALDLALKLIDQRDAEKVAATALVSLLRFPRYASPIVERLRSAKLSPAAARVAQDAAAAEARLPETVEAGNPHAAKLREKLAAAQFELECAERIDSHARWQRETTYWRGKIASINAELARLEGRQA